MTILVSNLKILVCSVERGAFVAVGTFLTLPFVYRTIVSTSVVIDVVLQILVCERAILLCVLADRRVTMVTV